MEKTFNKIYEKTKDIGFELFSCLILFVTNVIGIAIGIVYLLTSLLIVAPIASMFRVCLAEERFSEAYENVFMSMMALIYGESCYKKEDES